MTEDAVHSDRARRARQLERFEREFGAARRLRRVRAPGRVNLIGEHTDYNDLPVLPMALQRDTAILFAPRDDARVRLVNLDARFGAREFELSASIAPFAAGDWGNYVKAAAEILAREHGVTRGFDGVVAGDVPAASGLSSSAALVVASALALRVANGLELESRAFADLCARGERYVGTQGGGMDQAICIHGRRGHAVRIDFAPLRLAPVAMPAEWRFVIANSLVVADKSGSARDAYNSRRASCERALGAVRDALGEPAARYPDLLAMHGEDELLAAGARVLAAEELARFRHVVGEGLRVERAVEAMRAGDERRFGELMDASHASLAGDYAVSCAELDRLTELQRAAGAAGARLTGAGFGGCTVALCRAERAPALLAALDERFYGPRGAASEAFVACASDGAHVEE
ncbi:MAG: galactokinase [Planctomycetes bacterium]|nr:galactokinase [Planctomycetota bacterium]